MSSERKVLAQDQPQYSQSVRNGQTQNDSQYQQAEIDSQNAEIDRQNAAAEAEYQRQVAEYEKQQNQEKKDRIAEIQKQYDDKRAEIERQKADAINSIPIDPSNRRQSQTERNRIAKQYDSKISELNKNERLVVGQAQFSKDNPGIAFSANMYKQFASSSNATDLGTLYLNRQEAKQNKTEYKREQGVKEAVTKARAGQIAMQNIGTVQGSYGLAEGQVRADTALSRQTPNVVVGKQAVKTRPTLINVNTGQSIMGGQKESAPVNVVAVENRFVVQTDKGAKTFQTRSTAEKYAARKDIQEINPIIKKVERIIPAQKASVGVPSNANPRAYVAGLTYQNLSASGKPREEPLSMGGITESKKVGVEQTSWTGWNGQKTGKVQVSDPFVDRLVGALGYEKANEIIGNYNMITERNNLIIKEYNRKNKIEYFNYRREQVRNDPYFKNPKAQGPPKPKLENTSVAPTLTELVYANSQTPENKFIESSYKSLDELSIKMKRKGASEEGGIIQIAAEAGKSALQFAADIQNLGEQTVRPLLTGKSPTNRPVQLSSETTSSQLFPIGENWRVKTPEEMMGIAKRQYEKYGPGTFIGDMLPTFGIGAESLVRGGIAIVRESPMLVSYGLRQSERISARIPSKIRNFAERHPVLSFETWRDIRTVKNFAKENYPDYKNISIIKEKGQRSFIVSGGIEEKRPNISNLPVEPQLKSSTRTMNEPIVTKTPKKQSLPVSDKSGDLLFRIEFKKEFRLSNKGLVPVEKTGIGIARPTLPVLAKHRPGIIEELKKSVERQKNIIQNIPTNIRKRMIQAGSNLKESFSIPEKKAKRVPSRLVKLDWITEYTQPEKKLQYSKTERTIITSADVDFEKTALSLGMKRYGATSFVKENPNLRFMMKLEQAKKSGLLTETAMSREGPLKLFRTGKQKTIRIRKKEFTQFDFVGEKSIIGRFYEAKGGLGKSEFVKDVTKNKEIIPIGSKDFERKLGGADLYRNVEGTEPRVKPVRKFNFRSPYPTDIWDSQNAVAGGSGRSISLETQNTITIGPLKPSKKTNISTDYLKAVSNYKPNVETISSGENFITSEETTRYPDIKTNRLEIKTIPKLEAKTFAKMRGQIKTSQVSVQKQETLLGSVQLVRQETVQKTKQIQKMREKIAEKFTSRPKLVLGEIPLLVTGIKLGAALEPKQEQRQQQILKPLQVQKLKYPEIPTRPSKTRERPPAIPFVLRISKESKRSVRKSKHGEKADFLGNTSETQLVGIFNRAETTYGLRKIARLSAGDRRVEKGRKRSVRRPVKFVEGKPKDMFGFKHESKKSAKRKKFF